MPRPPFFDWWETWAYRFDLWRIVPRLALLIYGISSWRVAEWFMDLKEPTVAHGAFVSVVSGIAPLILNFYMQNGVDWEKRIERLTGAQQNV